MLFCSQDNNKKIKESNNLNHKIIKIHLSKTLCMIEYLFYGRSRKYYGDRAEEYDL